MQSQKVLFFTYTHTQKKNPIFEYSMSSSSNNTFFPYKSKMEREAMGSRPNRCVYNLPIKKKVFENPYYGMLLFYDIYLRKALSLGG
jgi:hypothetical protein